MTTAPSIHDQLVKFQERNLFSVDAWHARGVNPSADNVSQELTTFFHDCAGALAEEVTAGKPPRQLKKVLTDALDQLDKFRYDTEEREFIADLFKELGDIVGVDIRNAITGWMYGPLLVILQVILRFLRPERVVAVLHQTCTQCHSSLDLKIMRKKPGIPDAQWLVVRCKHCQELNLLSPGPEAAEMRFGQFEWVDTLSKDDYTYEQALVRMEQIKYFRK
ncbi:MAG: DUF4844 domain-containing protein [Bacteroidetes bacterium]|nr:DUF4844 domain-containing protein [Bacteroidota bacterium]